MITTVVVKRAKNRLTVKAGCLNRSGMGSVRLGSRKRFPLIVEALAELKRPAILDGEIVALDDHVDSMERNVSSLKILSTSSTPWPGSARGEAPSRASSSSRPLDERSHPGAGDVIDSGAVDRHLRAGLNRPTQKGHHRLGCLTVR